MMGFVIGDFDASCHHGNLSDSLLASRGTTILPGTQNYVGRARAIYRNMFTDSTVTLALLLKFQLVALLTMHACMGSRWIVFFCFASFVCWFVLRV